MRSLLALSSRPERHATREAAQLLTAGLRHRRRRPEVFPEDDGLVVLTTGDWRAGQTANSGLATPGSDVRAHWLAQQAERGEERVLRAGSSWRLMQVHQLLPDGGALVLNAADDWADNEWPLGVFVQLERYAPNGERRWSLTIAPCALVKVEQHLCLVAEVGVGDFLAAVPAELGS